MTIDDIQMMPDLFALSCHLLVLPWRNNIKMHANQRPSKRQSIERAVLMSHEFQSESVLLFKSVSFCEIVF